MTAGLINTTIYATGAVVSADQYLAPILQGAGWYGSLLAREKSTIYILRDAGMCPIAPYRVRMESRTH